MIDRSRPAGWSVGTLDRITGLAQIIRVEDSLQAGLYTLLGAYLASDATRALSAPVLRAALVVALIVAFGFVINDYQDVAVDMLNRPMRPIPSGRVSRRAAGALLVALAISALGLAWTLGLQLLLLALLTVILSAAYSLYLKNTLLLGNAAVALLDATIVLYGGLAAGNLTTAVWVVSVLTFLYIVAHEILHAVEDHAGDALAGLHTTVTRLGITAALRLFRIVALAFVVAALVPWFLGVASDWYLYAALLCSILPVVGVVVLLSRRVTDRTIRLSGRVMKWVWLSSLIPVVLLK